jgi:predicted AAA+ superfamily ATPase
MIDRDITPYLKELVSQFSVVTLLGPRQSGKTTLARTLFPDYAYVNLELPKSRRLAAADPELFFKNYPVPVIIDEVQHVPELLSYIQVFVDEHKRRGQFILTGSHQPKLRASISQSLAGRTAVLTLLPLSISELTRAGISCERDEYIFSGFLPRIFDENLPPERVHEAYYKTYVERDVRQLINVSNQSAFETFIKLLAGRVGQIVKLQNMAGDVGVSATTLASWLSVLEASFIIFRLPCYYNNFGKRLIKAQKIFFTDVGLAAHLLGIESPSQVSRDPLIGGLFENLVVLEALKTRYNMGKPADLYYFRDKNGIEVDLILDRGRKLHLFEIKSAMTPDASMAKHLSKMKSLVPQTLSTAVIYAGSPFPGNKDYSFVNFKETGNLIRKGSAPLDGGPGAKGTPGRSSQTAE